MFAPRGARELLVGRGAYNKELAELVLMLSPGPLADLVRAITRCIYCSVAGIGAGCFRCRSRARNEVEALDTLKIEAS